MKILYVALIEDVNPTSGILRKIMSKVDTLNKLGVETKCISNISWVIRVDAKRGMECQNNNSHRHVTEKGEGKQCITWLRSSLDPAVTLTSTRLESRTMLWYNVSPFSVKWIFYYILAWVVFQLPWWFDEASLHRLAKRWKYSLFLVYRMSILQCWARNPKTGGSLSLFRNRKFGVPLSQFR